MSLKTKGFSRKTEALILIGVGETGSELLIGPSYQEMAVFNKIRPFLDEYGQKALLNGRICNKLAVL